LLSTLRDEKNDKPDNKGLAEQIKHRGAEVLGKEVAEHYKDVLKSLEEMKRNPPKDETVLCVTEDGSPHDTFLLRRGNPHVPGDKVEPGFRA